MANATIDFLIVTDQIININAVNIKVLNMSFDDCVNLIEKKLQMKVAIDRPYKLCDFKPTYGVVFSEYLEGYDYWGYCDLDLIFGDLWYFLSKYKFYKYDRIFCFGHLSLFRNTYQIKHLYQLPGGLDYKIVFTTNKSYYFDEFNGLMPKTVNAHIKTLNKWVVADIIPENCELLGKKYGELYRLLSFNLKNYHRQAFCWEDGKVYQVYRSCLRVKKKELAYIHFQKRKFENVDEVIDYSAFFILRNKFLKSQIRVGKMLQLAVPKYDAKKEKIINSCLGKSVYYCRLIRTILYKMKLI